MSVRTVSGKLVAACMIAVLGTSLQAEVILGQNFWVVKWGGGAADPFANGYTNVSGSDPWKSGLMSELEPYQILRNMDLNHTNSHYHGVAGPLWSQRVQKTDRNQAILAYEWQIDMCNKSNSAYWLCVPHKANADYIYKLAQLVKNQLDPDLKIFLEYGNEVWNPGFEVHQYVDQKAKQINANAPWMLYYVKASVEVFYQFERVFGKNNPRIVKVLGSWASNPTTTRAILGILNGDTWKDEVNPHGVDVDAVAIATYFQGANQVDGSTKDEWGVHKKFADQYGVMMGFYEGGTGDIDNPLSPSMVGLYENYIDDLDSIGFRFGCHYYHAGTRGWQCIPNIGVGYSKASTYPKYKAWTDYAKAHPIPAVDEPLAPASSVKKAPAAKVSRPAIAATDIVYDLRGRRVRARGAADISGELAPKNILVNREGRILIR